MTGNRSPAAGTLHAETAALLPWYVNGTLDDAARRRVERHLADCAACRDDLTLDREIHRRLSADPSVKFMSGASLQRLKEALDVLPPAAAVPRPASSNRWHAWRTGRSARFAASAALVAMALGAGMPGVVRWLSGDRPRLAAPYRTVTTEEPRAAAVVIRAVFAPDLTLSELQSILGEAGLRIVAGPSDAAVYSLAATSTKPVGVSLAVLRAHAAVRFAESTQPARTAPP